MKKILTVLLAAVFIIQIGLFPAFAKNTNESVNEERTCPEEWIISGDDIEIQGGKYSYKLVIRSNKTLSFENDLEISYQGIEGRYQLNYEIEENGDHIMIVTGDFDHIIAASSLLENLSDQEKNQVLSHISGDSYSYQLILKTNEGFTYKNFLRYYYDSVPQGYFLFYTFDLLTDEQTLKISLFDEKQNE